jgi:acyl-CoA thioester hydrolase
MDEQRVLLQTQQIPVRWGDMDALGHVNNAAYFTYMEQARIAWLASVGAGDMGTGATHGSVIVNAACTFHKPITYPTLLQVQMHGGPPGRSSFESYYELRDAADPALLYASGSARIVWVDYGSGRSAPLPAGVRRHLPVPSSERQDSQLC